MFCFFFVIRLRLRALTGCRSYHQSAPINAKQKEKLRSFRQNVSLTLNHKIVKKVFGNTFASLLCPAGLFFQLKVVYNLN